MQTWTILGKVMQKEEEEFSAARIGFHAARMLTMWLTCSADAELGFL